jgi:hypothetical protein
VVSISTGTPPRPGQKGEAGGWTRTLFRGGNGWQAAGEDGGGEARRRLAGEAGGGPSSQAAEAERPVDGEDSRTEESHVSYLDG